MSDEKESWKKKEDTGISPLTGALSIAAYAPRWKHVREYYEKHRVLLLLNIFIVIGSPFLGLVLAGWGGVVVGLIVGAITFFLGLRAVIKVREIQEG